MLKTAFRVALLGASLTLVLAGAAWAHVEVSPGRVPAGEAASFTVEVPTEKEVPTTEVRLELPAGFEATRADAPPGWQGEVRDGALVWSGGEIPVAEAGEFSFEATVPDEAGGFALDAIQTYADGSVVEWAGAPDSDLPAPTVEVAAGGQAAGETDGPQHGDEGHGSHAEEVPDTGGVSPAVLLGAGALVLAASGALVAGTIRR